VMHEDIPAEMAALIKDRMSLLNEMVSFGCTYTRPGQGRVLRLRGARGRRQALKSARRTDWFSLTTYGKPLAAEYEGDVYSLYRPTADWKSTCAT